MKCGARTKAGHTCSRPRVKGYKGCTNHDPRLRERHRAVARKGGLTRAGQLARKVLADDVLPDRPTTIDEVIEHLGTLSVEVSHGRIEPKFADSAGRLLEAIRRAIQGGDEERDPVKAEVIIRVGAQEEGPDDARESDTPE